MAQRPTPPSRSGSVEDLLDTPLVSPATRTALRARMAWSRPAAPQCFDTVDFATLEAICACLMPQETSRRVDLAGRLDEQLADEKGDGWRYAELPPGRTAITRGVRGVNESAQLHFGAPFRILGEQQQIAILAAVQEGSATGSTWATLPPKRFFEDLLASVTALYYAHPFAQDDIRYVGMADAQGFHAIGLNGVEPFETPAVDASI